MRVTAILPAIFALTVAATVTPDCDAAKGEFSYTFTDAHGEGHTGSFTDPPAEICHNIPEAADPATQKPADSPINHTDKKATVFTEPNCKGDSFTLKPLKGHASDRLKLRSVIFS